MVFSLNSTTSSSNHLDLLRHLIDVAALADRRTALKLALLSRTTQAWVEPIIYAEVNLRHENSGRAFLWTIRNSTTKPPSFFAQHVKSLVVCSDVESQLVVEILSVCRGIINFSYWATPSTSVWIRQSQISRFNSIFGQEPNVISPQRMSVLLHEYHIYPLKPYFNLAFFSSVTHLSILNSWEEWTTWTHISSDTMPALTHIKFDMNVRRTPPSRLCNMEIQNSEFDSGFTKNETDELTISGSKLFRVANTLSEVLNNSQLLRVCILVLRFDADPAYTAKSIVTNLALLQAETDHLLAANWFDPRLVFAHEREPFRYSHAHSKHEMNLWKSAETMVNSQRYTTGYTILDCA